VRAPRTTLTCKAWPQEPRCGCLEHLDPEVAEGPDDLVVRRHRARRAWAAFDALVATLRSLEGDETMLCNRASRSACSAPTRGAAGADRNSNLVPDWATWRVPPARGARPHDVRADDWSWIYIGTQGILQGTYECSPRSPAVGSGIAWRHDHVDRRARRMGGRRSRSR
jgi:urocanate hydratase